MATITSIASGNWSDPLIWDSGTVPATGDDVVIASGTVVTIDIDIGSIGSDTGTNDALRVEGALQWNGDISSTATLYGNFHQTAGGVINFNGTTDRTKVLTFYLNASATLDILKYAVVLDDFTNVSINGYIFPNLWAILNQTALSGDTQIQISDITRISDWQVGDKIILLANDGRWEEKTITGISGDIITLDSGLTYDYYQNMTVYNASLNNIRFVCFDRSYPFDFNVPNTTATNPFTVSGTYIDNGFKHPYTNYANLGYLKLINSVFAGRGTFSNVGHTDSVYHYYNPGGYSVSLGKFYDNFTNVLLSSKPYAPNSLAYEEAMNKAIFRDCYIGCGIAPNDNINDFTEFYNCCFIRHTVGVMPASPATKRYYLFDNCFFDYSVKLQINTQGQISNCKFGTKTDYMNFTQNITIEPYTVDIYIESAEVYDWNYVDVVIAGSETLSVDEINGKHRHYTPSYVALAQDTIKFSGNEAVEIQSLQAGTFELKSKILVDNNTSYKFDIYLMKDSLTTTPPKVQLWKGTTLLSEAQMPDTTNTWEKVSVSWFSDFDGFIEIRFVFTSDTGTEKFWLSDERNSFHYWSEGYIIPVYPRNEVTPYTVAKAVWEYSTRTLTASPITPADIWGYTTRTLTDGYFSSGDRNNLNLVKEKTSKIPNTQKPESNDDIKVEIERLRNLILNLLTKRGGF